MQEAECRGQHFDTLSDRAEGFYVYYQYVVARAVKSVLTFMATAISEKSKLTYHWLVLFRENDKLVIEAEKLL